MKRILTILFFVIGVTLNAATYYVATTGNNGNPGTFASPWATWAYAFSNGSVVGGDTVYFRGGTYNITSGISITRSGSAGNYICYFAYPGETPILDGSGYSSSFNLMVTANSISYVHLKGLTIQNGITTANGAVGIRGMYLNHFILENMTFAYIEGCGIYYTGSTYTETINCDAHDCYDEHSTHPGNWGVGFCIDTESSSDNDGQDYFTGCRAWNCSDQGFSCGNNYGYVEYSNCWAYDNGSTSIGSEGEANGFKFGMPQYAPTLPLHVYVHNCISARNLGSGYDLNDGPYILRIHLYNNISYDNGGGGIPGSSGYGFVDFNASGAATDRIFRNNASYLNDVNNFYIYGGSYTSDHNTWDAGAPTINASDFQSLSYSQLSASRNADGSLPDITFGRLVEGSDLIDAGTDVGLLYVGTAPDLGWAEYDGDIDSIATDILTFTLADQAGAATINTTNHTIAIEVAYTADVTSLTPTITLSYGATISPLSGVSQNFTSPVTYTVTALDGTTTQAWVVTVTKAAEPPVDPPTSSSKIVKLGGLILKL